MESEDWARLVSDDFSYDGGDTRARRNVRFSSIDKNVFIGIGKLRKRKPKKKERFSLILTRNDLQVSLRHNEYDKCTIVR